MKFVALVVAFLMFSGCEKSESEISSTTGKLYIPFACNGYVTPLNPNSRETPWYANYIIKNNGSDFLDDGELYPRGWAQREGEHQLSVFFYTAYTGTINLNLDVQEAYANATIGVEIEGTIREVFIEKSDEEQICKVGKYKVLKPGYVRVNLTQIKIDNSSSNGESASYPLIRGFWVSGSGIGNLTKRCEKVMFGTPEDNQYHPVNPDLSPYWIRRAPYVLFEWEKPQDTEYFYNEVYVPGGNDVKGAYFETTGGDGFYMGVQPYTDALNLDGRVVLFSVWDTDTEAGDFAELVNIGEGVVSNGYNNEGSGIQNFYKYDWKVGCTYATMVRVRPEVIDGQPTGASLYTGYFRGDEGWVFIAEVRRPNIETYLTKPYSFNENFMAEQGWLSRTVYFPSQWMRDKDGNWHEITRCRFRNSWGVNKVRYDYKAGVDEQNGFYLTTAGYFDDGRTPEYTNFSRKPSGVAPNVDLAELERLSSGK